MQKIYYVRNYSAPEKSEENLEKNKNYEEIFFADIGNLEKVTANLLLPKFSAVMQ